MLLQNQTLHAQYPYKTIGATATATQAGNLRSQLGIRGSSQLTRFVSGWSKWQSIPQGYSIDSSLFAPLKGGGMGASAGVEGRGALVSNMAMGKNCEATLAGSGSITPPNLSLLVSLACTILAEGDLSASMVGTVNMAATLAGQGDIDGALGMIAWVTATLTGEGEVSSSTTMFGPAHMSANIYVNSGTASTKELAAEVWNSLAADFTAAGTMGEKLDAAGTAGDPWTADLETYAGNQAGGQVLTKKKFLIFK